MTLRIVRLMGGNRGARVLHLVEGTSRVAFTLCGRHQTWREREPGAGEYLCPTCRAVARDRYRELPNIISEFAELDEALREVE